MKNFNKLLLTVLVALVSCLSVKAYDFKVDGIYYNILSKEKMTCEVTNSFEEWPNNRYDGSFIIPSNITVDGLTFTVTRIGNSAFENSYYSGELPGLVSIKLPNTIEEIGYGAFSQTPIKEIVLPSSLKKIDRYAFSNTGIESILIPESVTELGEHAFSGCGLLKEVALSYSINIIGKGTFKGCRSLERIEIPNSVYFIDREAFYECKKLNSIVLSENLTTIENAVFFYCDELESIVIPNSVTEIKTCPFGYCPNLEEITLPSGLTMISGDLGCSSLKKLICRNTIPATVKEGKFFNISLYSCVLEVPKGSLEKYKSAEGWSDFFNIVESESTDINITEKCSLPEITIKNNQIIFSCDNPNAKFNTTILCRDHLSYNDKDFISLTGIYDLKTYAHADGYKNSETVTATLVWVNPTIAGGEDIFNMEAKKAVVISSSANGIRVSGTTRGEMISVYSLDGGLIKNTTADDGETKIECPQGIVLVKIGDKSVKVNVKF